MLKPSLQVRLSQHLALTPQLQQSIRLLQLSTLELQQEIEQMLESNPFLEADDEAASFDTAPSERASATELNSEQVRERDESDGGDTEPALAEVKADDFGATERDDWENGTERDDFDGIRETPGQSSNSASGEDDGGEFERGGGSISLQEHLRAQMAGMRLSAEDRAALEVLIESLNGDGYLADALEDIAARLAEMLGIEADADEARDELMARLQCALQWLHSMEPLGVGARSPGRMPEPAAARRAALRGAGHRAGDLPAPPGAAGQARLQASGRCHRRRRRHGARGAGADRALRAQAGPGLRADRDLCGGARRHRAPQPAAA